MSQLSSLEDYPNFDTVMKTEVAEKPRKLSDEVLLALPNKAHSCHSDSRKTSDDKTFGGPFDLTPRLTEPHIEIAVSCIELDMPHQLKTL